jgi:hypothetical protein
MPTPNHRIFYAAQAVGLASFDNSPTAYTAVRGLQQLGVNTKFNLEQVFEIGQLEIYDNIEHIPDVEITMEKVLDGYCPIFLLATQGSPAATLIGRSTARANVALAIYAETVTNASGTPLSQCIMSGVYVSQLGYDIMVEGLAKESVTLVGNNKVWATGSFTFTGMTTGNGVSSMAPAAPEGVDRRENIVMTGCVFPNSIRGIVSNANTATSGVFAASLQSIKVSANLGRDQLLELGRKGPYFRYVNWPVEVTTAIEIMGKDGDLVVATETGIYSNGENVTAEPIKVVMQEGLVLDMGTRNRLSSVNYGGGNAGSRGGNATVSLSYVGYNDLTVQHPADPTVGLRP